MNANILTLRQNLNSGVNQQVFGSTNPDHYTGDLKYIKVDNQRYWQVSLDAVSVGQNKLSVKANQAIIDTGTTLIVAPPEIVRHIHSNIHGSLFTLRSGWLLPCSVNTSTEKIDFELGGQTFAIPVADLVREVSLKKDYCYSGMVESELPFTIMGDVFLKSWYSVFDFGNARVGFAASKR
jgi:hypothetical protein